VKLTRIVTSLLVANVLAFGISGCSKADGDKAKVEAIVHDYIVKNPEVLVESLQSMQQKQMDQARKSIQKTQEVAPSFVDELFHQSSDPVSGNAKGAITIVEFFDYQCPHCIEMVPVIEAIEKANPNVRVVYKEFPIRGPMSEFASRAMLAAQLQGKYVEMHKALMRINQLPLTEDLIIKAAQSAGVDVEKMKTDMKTDAIDSQVKANYKLAQSLALIGTPAFFIAKSDVTKDAKPDAIAFIPGGVDKVQLQGVINKISK
jgi:protein-disulfide isomerase